MPCSTDPLQRAFVLLFFALISTSVFGQTTIRERIEIRPQVQGPAKAMTQAQTPFFTP